ncbi:TIGR02117 family protein [Aureisphaera galaxeae]|uniref:TIGR02117 family protein n=1 Tax=Aureisphaera galaxeae TaxID=1538023 RepID=UPI00234FF3D8|nr:TIGR02117 family protein [Aureisphaera galaxeae]MDC8002789.1 TIGR02117 family protein [Aureisphaera galaxeae]
MRLVKKILKVLGYMIAVPVAYFLIALLLSTITVNKASSNSEGTDIVYLSTNGVHLDIVIPRESLSENLSRDLRFLEDDQYVAFGWGDENFYLNTPTWGDLTFKNAFRAMFLKSSSLVHLTRHKSKRSSWVAVPIDKNKLEKLNDFILKSFSLDASGGKIELPNTGYYHNDHFYKAEGSYSFVKTCNSWVNSGFKESGLKASYWTPFDFGLLNKYE